MFNINIRKFEDVIDELKDFLLELAQNKKVNFM